MSFSFEKYQKPDDPRDQHFASIRKNSGYLQFTKSAAVEFCICQHEYAFLYWDREQSVMGVELLYSESRGAFEIHKCPNGTAAIRCKPFFEAHGVCLNNSIRVSVEKDDDSGVLVLRGIQVDEKSTVIAEDGHSELITEKEAARLLGCCERSVYMLRKDGKIRCVKIGTAVRYARSEVDRFVKDEMK